MKCNNTKCAWYHPNKCTLKGGRAWSCAYFIPSDDKQSDSREDSNAESDVSDETV